MADEKTTDYRIEIGKTDSPDKIDVTLVLDSVKFDTTAKYEQLIRCFNNTNSLSLKLKGSNILKGQGEVISFDDSNEKGNLVIDVENTGSLEMTNTEENANACIKSSNGDINLKKGKVTVNNGCIIGKNIYIHDGELYGNNSHISSENSVIVSGGVLNLKTNNNTCLSLKNQYVQTGGRVSLAHTGSGDGIDISDSTPGRPQKAVDISGGSLLISSEKETSYPNGIAVNHGNNDKRDICISGNADITISGVCVGIRNMTPQGKIRFSGGRVVITAKDIYNNESLTGPGRAIIVYNDEADLSSVSFEGKYAKDGSHKNYMGKTAKSRKEISDSDLKELRDYEVEKYLAILPPAKITKAPTAKKLVYTEAAQKLINEGKAQPGPMEYAVSNSSSAPKTGWSTSVPKKTKDGTYTVWYRAKDTDKYASSAAKKIKVTIAALSIKLESQSAKYSGNEPKLTVKSIKYGKKPLSKKLTDYKITYSPATFKKVGKYTVKFKCIKSGSYNGKTGTVEFTIEKAANPISVKLKKAPSAKASDLKKKQKTFKVSDVLTIKNKKTKVTYDIKSTNKKITIDPTSGTIKLAKGLKKGNYKVTVKVKAAANTNYKAKTKSVDMTIKISK